MNKTKYCICIRPRKWQFVDEMCMMKTNWGEMDPECDEQACVLEKPPGKCGYVTYAMQEHRRHASKSRNPIIVELNHCTKYTKGAYTSAFASRPTGSGALHRQKQTDKRREINKKRANNIWTQRTGFTHTHTHTSSLAFKITVSKAQK